MPFVLDGARFGLIAHQHAGNAKPFGQLLRNFEEEASAPPAADDGKMYWSHWYFQTKDKKNYKEHEGYLQKSLCPLW